MVTIEEDYIESFIDMIPDSLKEEGAFFASPYIASSLRQKLEGRGYEVITESRLNDTKIIFKKK